MHRDEVGPAEKLVERQQLDTELRRARRRDVGVVRHDVGLESSQPLRDQLPDAPQPDHSDRLAEDLGARERRALPRVLAQRGIGCGDLASGRQQQRHGVLGGAVDVRRRGIDYQHTAFGGGVDVDVVQPDPGARDDLQFRRGAKHLGVDGGRRTDQKRVGFGHRRQQLLAVRAVHPAHLNLVTQGFNGRFGKFVSDENNRQAHAASLMVAVVTDCVTVADRGH